jgi:hypothetical protein
VRDITSGFTEGYDVRKTWESVRPGPDTCGVAGTEWKIKRGVLYECF